MKKNVEWLKEEIGIERKLLSESLVGAQETEVERIFNDGKEHGLIFASNRINQLDEPEVLSQEWIEEHIDYADVRGGTQAFIHVDDLQNLLVPKQELVEENKRLNELLITMQEEVDQAYRKGFKEGERQTAEYFESITEEPSKEQVWKYLSEHGIKIADKEPETVADVVTTFWKSYERLKEVMNMEVEELEE